MQDIVGDSFDILEVVGQLVVANLLLDEPKLKSFIFNDKEEADVEEIEIGIIIKCFSIMLLF